jgi:predicted amidohydrolase YtcJ
MTDKRARLTRNDFLKLSATAAGGALLGLSRSEAGNARAGAGRFATDVAMAAPGSADVVLRNGKVVVMDDADTVAQAIAVKDGLVLQAGLDPAIDALIGPSTRVIDLRGRTLTPGFVDSHLHFQVVAQFNGFYTPFMPPDVVTLGQLQDGLAEEAAKTPQGEWIKAIYLTVGSEDVPTRSDLDPVTPNHPLFLIHIGGHWGTANSKALQAAGITSATPNPTGGIIERDGTGQPTGVLYNHQAMDLIRRVMPRYDDASIRAGILAYQQLFASYGVTSYQDNNIRGAATVADYQQIAKEGRMSLRSTLYITLEYPSDLDAALHQVEHYEDAYCRFAGAKFLIDGQAPTAYCYEPHNGASWQTTTWDIAAYKQTVRTLHDAGFQICTHCVGDAAMDVVLDAYEEAMSANPRPDPRHRLEHAVLSKPASTQRIKDLGVVISTQPHFIRQGGDAYEGLFGAERLDRVIVTREWIDAGIPVAISSDAPTTIWYRPQVTLAAALSRVTATNQVIGPDQVMSIHEAMRAHTIVGAYAAHEEDIKGSLEPGKLADLVVWRDDPYSLYPRDLQYATLDLTMIGGRIYNQQHMPRRHLLRGGR